MTSVRNHDIDSVSNKRKLKSEDESPKVNGPEERFYLKKMSPAEVARMLQEPLDTTSSDDSDEEDDNGCWAISKSPLKRSRTVRGSLAVSLDCEALLKNSPNSKNKFVSPVKLKRKSEMNKINMNLDCNNSISSVNEKQKSSGGQEVLAQIQNSPELNRKLSSRKLPVNRRQNVSLSSPRANLASCKTSSCSSATHKENTMRNETSHPESESSIAASEDFNGLNQGSKTPQKSGKTDDLFKSVRVVVQKLDSDVLNVLNLNNPQDLNPDQSDSEVDPDNEQLENKAKRMKILEESDLAVPLEIATQIQRKSFRLKVKAEEEKSLLNCSNQSKRRTAASECLYKLRIKANSDSDDSSSEDSSDEQLSPLKQLTPRAPRRVATRKENEVVEKLNSNQKRNTPRSSSRSPAINSGKSMSLRKRTDIKRPWFDDVDLKESNNRRVMSDSSSTPKKYELDETDSQNDSIKGKTHSPRTSLKIRGKETSKKEAEKKLKSTNKEPDQTTRSSARLRNHLSPLVNSVEKISLRNRSELKLPFGDEYEIRDASMQRRLSIINSPRTPTQSLRKQVLESTTTRSAKKKLIMDPESSDSEEELVPLRRTPRKCVSTSVTTPNKTSKTPSKSNRSTPQNKQTPDKKTPSKRKVEPSTPCTPKTVRRVGQGFLTPVVEDRSVRHASKSSLENVRLKLHVSTVPTSLPCRLNEFKNIHSFISCKLKDKTGGCMYISGVPGTGKTATVHALVKTLQQEAIDRLISPFDFVEVNGLRLTEARQAYVRIWQSLSGSKVSTDLALSLLDKKFSGKPSRPTVLLIDELDYVCNRRQDVIYNVLDWCTRKNSRLIVLTIANTMDLPERTLKGRVTSRMGLTRLVFQPYSYQQLQEIVMDRIQGSSSFDPDAVQFVARKVAAVSGDARRALDICRRATELLERKEKQVTLEHVDKTLSQIFHSRRVQAIKHCSYMAQLLLRSIRDETLRTGIEESNLRDVFSHLSSICNLEGSWQPTVGQTLSLCSSLASSGLIAIEKGRHDILTKLTLNVSSDDIHYALSC